MREIMKVALMLLGVIAACSLVRIVGGFLWA